MRPATPHYVVTLEPTMVYGKHFYCDSTLDRSCYGVVHALLADQLVTNTSHPELISSIVGHIPWLQRLSTRKPGQAAGCKSVPFSLQ